jgi:hypothetical protein
MLTNLRLDDLAPVTQQTGMRAFLIGDHLP